MMSAGIGRRRGRAWSGVIMVLAVAVGGAALGACGGGDGGEDTSAAGSSEAPSVTTTTEVADATTEVPKFLGDLDRVCTTQVGFAGLTAYEKAPGIHPVVLFDDFRGEGDFVESARQLPAGWTITQDSDFEDASELEAIQLVACSDRVAESPTGIRCAFDDDEAGKVELELVDATYELKVYAASTGELQHEQTLEAKETKCPFVATFRKGDTTLVDQPSDDDYIAALKPVVAP